jgi:hypothetical protein
LQTFAGKKRKGRASRRGPAFLRELLKRFRSGLSHVVCSNSLKTT